MAVEIYVFSYNRGVFLENCVRSAQKYFLSPDITIVDDFSDDQSTLDILDMLSSEVKVINGKCGAGFLGGFYSNMQFVLDELAKGPWVIFIEDDMQFIRPFLDLDMARVNNFFDINPQAAVLSVDFFRDDFRDWDKGSVAIDYKVPVYFFCDSSVSYRGTVHFNSKGILHIERMRDKGFKYGRDRYDAMPIALKSFSKMGYYPYPFMMFLPFAPTTKSRSKTFVRRCLELYYRTGFFPYRELSSSEVDYFLNRDINILPYAGDFLKTCGQCPGPPYEFKDSLKRVNRFFSRLDKLERVIREKIKV